MIFAQILDPSSNITTLAYKQLPSGSDSRWFTTEDKSFCSEMKAKSCWEIQFLCLVQSRTSSFCSKKRSALFLHLLSPHHLPCHVGCYRQFCHHVFFIHAERRQNCQKEAPWNFLIIAWRFLFNRVKWQAAWQEKARISQPSKIISSSEGLSAHEGQQVPSNFFHSENKTHETTVTFRRAVVFPSVTVQIQL